MVNRTAQADLPAFALRATARSRRSFVRTPKSGGGRIRLYVALLSMVLALAMAHAPDAARAVHAQGAARRTLFDGARVIVGDGQPAIERAAILVENGTISRVGPRGFEVPPGTERVDLTGKTVIPGIVTLHGHVGYLKDVTF